MTLNLCVEQPPGCLSNRFPDPHGPQALGPQVLAATPALEGVHDKIVEHCSQHNVAKNNLSWVT